MENSKLEKQIEEMAKSLCKYSLTEYCASGRCENPNCLVNAKALEALYNAGYRKASEIARRIIAEIDDALHNMATEYANAGHHEYFAVCEMVYHNVIRPVEKKYTEGKK